MRVEAQSCAGCRVGCRASTNANYIKRFAKPALADVSPRLRMEGVDFIVVAGRESRKFRKICLTIAGLTFFA